MSRDKTKGKVGQLRIIAGDLRGRILEFDDAPGLRPTGDRIRETLFNWLQYDIAGSRCLDLFAGSGALGFEAASRGAGSVTMVESNAKVVARLGTQQVKLKLGCVQVTHTAASQFLAEFNANSAPHQAPFDIAFVDPPFDENIHDQILGEIVRSEVLRNGALVYLESSADFHMEVELARQFEVIRAKKSGAVKYQLLHLTT